MSEEKSTTSYDEIPYPSDPFRQTHPAVVATVATLFGLQPPPVERCKVLEIGCAAGGNLLPMAMELPDAQFVGIDLSPRQIAGAKETASVLGLQNIQFESRNVMDIGADFGQFDYIVSHGVFSWVPTEVADKILDVCCRNLTANGVAYISYNTLPGWHMRGMIRDMMCYHTQQFARPPIKIRQARALLKFLAEAVPSEKNPYGQYLRAELELLQRMRDAYIYHEHLEKENNPLYFHQFAERAQKHGLQFLGEAAFGAMAVAAHDLPQQVMTTLRKVTNNLIAREQYMDFVRNRTFRQTLLCHQEAKLDLSLNPEHMAPLYVSSPAEPVKPDADIQSPIPVDFRGPGGVTVPIRQPVTKAALLLVREAWPRGVRLDALAAAARARLDPQGTADEATLAADRRTLGTSLQSLFALGFVDLTVRETPSSPALTDCPRASRLVIHQVQSGRAVTNLRHRLITVDEFERRLLQHLDGRHNKAQLLEIIQGLVANGTLVLKQNGGQPQSPDQVSKLLADGIDRSLGRFREFHLLVG
jgi:methyltransferase-like protein/SAM-dependent methyltransferase